MIFAFPVVPLHLGNAFPDSVNHINFTYFYRLTLFSLWYSYKFYNNFIVFTSEPTYYLWNSLLQIYYRFTLATLASDIASSAFACAVIFAKFASFSFCDVSFMSSCRWSSSWFFLSSNCDNSSFSCRSWSFNRWAPSYKRITESF